MGETILDLLIRTVGSFLAIYGFAVVQETPRKYVMQAALVGGISGLVYWLTVNLGAGDVFASFCSAFVAALLSHIFARTYKVPTTLFLIAGALPTVPGAGMYRTVYYFIAKNDTLTMYYLTQTLLIAGVIALALFIVDSLFGKSGKRVFSIKKEQLEGSGSDGRSES